jgi:hypothetical protein
MDLSTEEIRVELLKYLDKYKHRRPNIVVCDGPLYEELQMEGALEVLESTIQRIELKLLGLCNLFHKDGSYRTVICKPSFGTRAIDYRSTEGINLFVTTPLINEREVQQVYGRVGRFGDSSKIFVLGPLIDDAAQAQSANYLMKHQVICGAFEKASKKR